MTPTALIKALTEGEIFEAARTIIYKRVSSQVDTHFIDRIHLVGVPDAAAEIAALVIASQDARIEELEGRLAELTRLARSACDAVK
jgi:hypothetical protein